MEPAFVTGRLHAGMGDEERRAHAVLVEQVSKICQNLKGRPFDIDGKADGVWIKAARPLEISYHHDIDGTVEHTIVGASYTKVNSRVAGPMRQVGVEVRWSGMLLGLQSPDYGHRLGAADEI